MQRQLTLLESADHVTYLVDPILLICIASSIEIQTRDLPFRVATAQQLSHRRVPETNFLLTLFGRTSWTLADVDERAPSCSRR